MEINLLDEILEKLKAIGRTEDEIIFVTDGLHSTYWLNFKEQIANICYNSEDSLVINSDIKIVGYQWWLERQHRYLSKTWHWEYKTCPKNPANPGSILVKLT